MFLELKNAFNDIFSNKIRGLVYITSAITILVFILLFITFGYSMTYFELKESPIIEKVIEFFGFFLLFIASFMMFPAIATFVSGFFIDSVVDKAAKIRGITNLKEVSIADSVKTSGILAIKGALTSLGLIPVSLILGVIPFVNLLPIILYYRLNGGLLAREYFFAVALRFIDLQQAEQMFEDKKAYWTKAGIIIALLMTCPVVNILSPLIAMAFMQRLFFKQREQV